MYGEGLHQCMGFDSRTYPGGVPGDERIFYNSSCRNSLAKGEMMGAGVDAGVALIVTSK